MTGTGSTAEVTGTAEVTVLLAETDETDLRGTARAVLLRGAAAVLGVPESQLGVGHRPAAAADSTSRSATQAAWWRWR